MYEKRHMWATTHIRGKFFAGFKTTSRCEGLHSIIAKYVKSQYNLVDFIKHFKRCLTYLRYKEVEADYVFISGLLILKTALEPLKRSASNFYTRKIFFIFRPMLVRAARMKVVKDVAFDSFVLYIISKYGSLNSSWEVSVDNERTKFNCSCLRMDSFGIPCEHIVCVLVFLNILELPKSLVLTRWSKNAKTSTFDSSGVTWESIILSQYGCLMDWCWQLSYVASRRQERFHLVQDTVMSLIEDFEIEDEQEKQVGAEADNSDEGHNKKSCPLVKDIQQQTNATSYGINRNHVEEGLDADAEMEFWASDLEEDYEEQEFWAGDSDASADMELSEEFSMHSVAAGLRLPCDVGIHKLEGLQVESEFACDNDSKAPLEPWFLWRPLKIWNLAVPMKMIFFKEAIAKCDAFVVSNGWLYSLKILVSGVFVIVARN
ncbi:protein FAR1-RELATED SEQUENCE 9-like [Arachis stenosperma]|uniref:protein FAR1-RELATED SEQUENCE 9-like n=1 Tax=Arachis stenosperma TaxID=217475 RepID=UPI0025ABD613|nr:protein FAR1-RELATED SEQUENCE 9-like [Arachis stenosperma]